MDFNQMKLGWNKDTKAMMAAMPKVENYLIGKEFDALMEKVPDQSYLECGGYQGGWVWDAPQ